MTDKTIDRRRFFGTGAAAVAGATLITPAAVRAQGASGWKPVMEPQDAWMEKAGSRHRIAFDCTTPAAASAGLDFANNYIHTSMSGYNLTAADLAVILIFRHWATPYAFNDAIWAKYGKAIVGALKLEGDLAKGAERVNPLFVRPADAAAQPKGFEWFDDKYLGKMIGQGAMFAVCGLASQFFAAKLAGATGDPKAIYAELAANLIPNAHMAPSGIAAVGHVQEHGYAFSYVSAD